MSTSIKLPEIPKDKDYEDYIAATLQAAGLYIERNIIYREEAEIMELDIFSNNFMTDKIDKKLVEIKSGDWGFSDIFKIRGWMTYLGMSEGVFVVQKHREHFEYYKNKARELKVSLVKNSIEKEIEDLCDTFDITIADKTITHCIRYSYLLERKMLEEIKQLKKKNPQVIGYKKLDNFFFAINSRVFFTSDILMQIKKIFNSFVEYKHIAAKLNSELETGAYNDDAEIMSKKCFSDTFYYPQYSPIHIALHIEHIARISILRYCTEYIIATNNGSYDKDSIFAILNHTTLPENIKHGLSEIANDNYFYKYPIFWQVYTYVMGGFILEDFKDQEYSLLSNLSGIPVDEIPNAFKAFDILFPLDGGWQVKYGRRNITTHEMFPVPLRGIGANLRCYLYCKKGENNYESLSKKVSGQYTMDDLLKWNNLAYQFLSK